MSEELMLQVVLKGQMQFRKLKVALMDQMRFRKLFSFTQTCRLI